MADRAPSPIDEHVGARIRMLRVMRKVSQTDLGDGIGITFQQVQKYEKGSNRVGASRLQKIAEILKVPVGYFFEGLPGTEGGKNFLPPYLMKFMGMPEGARMVEAFSKIENLALRHVICSMVISVADMKKPQTRRTKKKP